MPSLNAHGPGLEIRRNACIEVAQDPAMIELLLWFHCSSRQCPKSVGKRLPGPAIGVRVAHQRVPHWCLRTGDVFSGTSYILKSLSESTGFPVRRHLGLQAEYDPRPH